MQDATAKPLVCHDCGGLVEVLFQNNEIRIKPCRSCKLARAEEAFDRGFDDGFVTGRAKKGT